MGLAKKIGARAGRSPKVARYRRERAPKERERKAQAQPYRSSLVFSFLPTLSCGLRRSRATFLSPCQCLLLGTAPSETFATESIFDRIIRIRRHDHSCRSPAFCFKMILSQMILSESPDLKPALHPPVPAPPPPFAQISAFQHFSISVFRIYPSISRSSSSRCTATIRPSTDSSYSTSRKTSNSALARRLGEHTRPRGMVGMHYERVRHTLALELKGDSS